MTFVELGIALILPWGDEFSKHVLNFCFKLDEIVPGYGSIVKKSFLGTAGITLPGT